MGGCVFLRPVLDWGFSKHSQESFQQTASKRIKPQIIVYLTITRLEVKSQSTPLQRVASRHDLCQEHGGLAARLAATCFISGCCDSCQAH